MAALPNIQQVIDIGNASLPYSLNDFYKGALFNKSIATQKSCTEIAMFTDILAWQFETSPSDTTLRGTANYLIWLCGMFKMQAQNASGGGGSVIPVPGVGSLNPLSFEVSGTSPIATGGNTITLDSGIYDYRGYNLLFTRNNIPQSLTNNGGTYFTWNKVTGVFVCIGAAAAGELFDLTPTI